MLFSLLLAGTLSFTGGDLTEEKTIADTIRLKEVVVSSKLKRYSSGLSIKSISSSEIRVGESTQLSELLSNQSNISVNSYGSGGTSGVSIRGLKASQTAVLWNGINLQSTMNGEVNIGNIPTFFVDQIAVQQGGNGALFGSGAIGGVIHLDNTLAFNEGHSGSILQSLGSCGLTYTGLKYSYSGENTSLSTRVFYTESANDYKFKNVNSTGKPIERQHNSNYRKGGIMVNSAFNISNNDKLVFALWGQDGYSRLPQPMSGSAEKPFDYNSFARGTVQWQATRKKYSFNVKAALLNDWQNYRSPKSSFGPYSDHHTTVGLLEAEAMVPFGDNHSLEAGLSNSYERATSTNYKDTKFRYKPAATLGYRFKSSDGDVEAFASLRQEVIDTQLNPITWSLGTQYRLAKGLLLRGNISRNYRVPTFNELYWDNWGNASLKPEHGYGEEVGMEFLHSENGFLFNSKLSVFNNNVNGWIIWVPADGGKWTSENVDKVWSRGVELGVTLKQRYQQYIIGCDLSGLMTTSTNQDTKLQLPYTPKYRGSVSLNLQASTYLIRYSHSFVGERYMSKNSGTLPAYSIAGITLEKSISLNRYQLSSFIRIDNIWNVDYQSIADYGMPLRNFQLGIRLNIGKINEN